jgi:hypothetical protein
MEKKGGQRIFVLSLLVILTIIILIIIPLMWLGYGEFKDSEGNLVEATLTAKIIITSVCAIFILGGWWQYNHQKKLDQGSSKMVVDNKKGFGDKALSTSYKIGGWHLRLKAIGTIILGLILIVVGVYFAISTKNLIILVISGLGALFVLFGWISWYRAKSLVKGRFY